MAGKKQKEGVAKDVSDVKMSLVPGKKHIPSDELTRSVQESITKYNISVDDLADSLDAGLLEASAAMREQLKNSDPDVQIAAANAIRGMANHVIQRRKLALDSTKKVEVYIGEELQIVRDDNGTD